MVLERSQIQHLWVHLRVESKYIYVWQVSRPITFGFGINAGPNTYGIDHLCRPYILGHEDFFYLFLYLLT
jgi:hypothetical protein